MDNPATSVDLQSGFFRPLTDYEESIAQTWLDRAFRHLTRRRTNLAANVTAGTVSLDDVTDVVCAMAGRVLSNPEAKRSETIDDYSYTRDAAVSAGILYATDDELASITPTRVASSSVRLTIYGTT